MANAANTKLLDDTREKIAVYSFAGSVIIPTEQGSYWANAVGGVIESRPTGNPFILFALKYIWGLGGEVSEFPEPIRIRLNTAMAVTEQFDFKFMVPEPEVTEEDPAALSLLGGVDDEDYDDEVGDLEDDDDEDNDDEDNDDEDDDDEDNDDEDDDLDEGFIDDEAEDGSEIDKILAKANRSEDEIRW